jgi:hypothetical protein
MLMATQNTVRSVGLKTPEELSARQEERASAGTGIFRDNAEGATKNTVAPSVAAALTTRSSGNASPSLHLSREEFPELFAPLPLAYHDFADSIIARIAKPDTPSKHIKMYKRIVTPYNADAFEHELKLHNLLYRYPSLINILQHGASLGDMPQLTKSIIIPNHPSVAKYPQVVRDYLAEEKSKGHMSGPFSLEEMESFMHGPIILLPLIVAKQIQGPGIPTKY